MMNQMSLIFIVLVVASFATLSASFQVTHTHNHHHYEHQAHLHQNSDRLCFKINKNALLSTKTPALRSRSVLFGGGRGTATLPEGKRARVEYISSQLDNSDLIYSVPAGSITCKQVGQLRDSLPASTIVSVVKNTLMIKAIEGNVERKTKWGSALPLCNGANMWFFVRDSDSEVPEGESNGVDEETGVQSDSNIAGTLTAFNAFCKANKKMETHMYRGGVLEGEYLDSAKLSIVEKLPSKKELIKKIAHLILSIPTKVAKVIKAPSAKLAKAIKLATEEMHKTGEAE
jgi:large subunit ribosomal protein L10